VAGRRRRRTLPRLRARQRPPLPQVVPLSGSVFRRRSCFPMISHQLLLPPWVCQFHARGGFGGAQGYAGDPRQGERQVGTQGGSYTFGWNSASPL
jgi:hypothetical protein